MLDLDDFKVVNDAHGHPVGDAVLRELSKILQSNARETDFVTRYGGEEFAIILPNSNAAMATMVAERIRRSVEIHLFTDLLLTMTISAGIATFPDNEKIGDLDELIQAADAALYMAKKEGKNITKTYGGPIDKSELKQSSERMKKDKRI